MCMSEADDSVNGISRRDAMCMFVSAACTARGAMLAGPRRLATRGRSFGESRLNSRLRLPDRPTIWVSYDDRLPAQGERVGGCGEMPVF